MTDDIMDQTGKEKEGATKGGEKKHVLSLQRGEKY